MSIVNNTVTIVLKSADTVWLKGYDTQWNPKDPDEPEGPKGSSSYLSLYKVSVLLICLLLLE